MKNWAYILSFLTFGLFCIIRFNYESEAFASFDENMDLLLGGNKVIGFFHYFGETKLIIVVTLILVFILYFKLRNYRGMIFVLLTVLVGNELNQLVKKWVERLRPEIPDQFSSFSFPSGHAMVGLLYLFTIAYLVSEILNDQHKKLILWIGIVLFVFLIGLSRIAESRHFGTDVLAGWCLGYTWFCISVFWYERKNGGNNT